MDMSRITSLKAREMLDSRGTPTIEVACTLASGATGSFAVPSGASTGMHEAHELRDGDPARFAGKGTLGAVGNVNGQISGRLAGEDFDQATLDAALIELDGTPDKGKLGANAILGVSLAFARAAAAERGVELYEHLRQLSGTPACAMPRPLLNVINGGKHADSGLAFQEFMLIPAGPTFRDQVRSGAALIASLRASLSRLGLSTSVGDEGGFAPRLASNEAALDLLTEAIAASGEKATIGIDAAASTFYRAGRYEVGEASWSSEELTAHYRDLADRYPISLIEDSHAEDDWAGFAAMTASLGERVLVVGDDLLVTNVARIAESAARRATNAVLIKPNQIGTLTETLAAIAAATANGMVPVISHRSGETLDDFIADLAVGTAAPFIKAGSLARGERVAKYNRLLRIEEGLAAS